MTLVRLTPAALTGRRVRVGRREGFAVAVTEGGELLLRLPAPAAELGRRLRRLGCVVTAGPLPKVRRACAHGTPFQLRVWAACRRIPPGRTATYGELAARLGCRSARAVGAALGANPLALLIPCHRVVAAGGDGGFAWGLARKRRWLRAERDAMAR